MTKIADPRQNSLRLVRGLHAIDLALVVKQPTLLAAIKLCIASAGFERDKQIAAHLDIDAGHWTRIQNGEAHFPVDKLSALMDLCGNEAPLLWLVNTRGYDAARMPRQESAIERENRELREQVEALQAERAVELRLMRELRA